MLSTVNVRAPTYFHLVKGDVSRELIDQSRDFYIYTFKEMYGCLFILLFKISYEF